MEYEFTTKEGYQRLLEKKQKLEQELAEAGVDAGEACGSSCDWHDNPGYDLAIEKMRILSAQLGELEIIIMKTQIIEDEVVSDIVAIGTTVVIDFEGDEETYFIGGSADSNPSQGIISYKTPLAQAILNAKVGETRVYSTKTRTFQVKILKIGKDAQ